MTSTGLLIVIGKWGGRLTALLLALFWGMFFVEHLLEWFLRGDGRYPPPMVWAGQAFHGLMILGFLLMLRWDRLGTAVMLAGTVAFFVRIGELDMIPMALINVIPIAFFTLYWLARRS